jgi:hypothetical protein
MLKASVSLAIKLDLQDLKSSAGMRAYCEHQYALSIVEDQCEVRWKLYSLDLDDDATSEEMAAHVELFSRLIMEAKLVGIHYTDHERAAMFVGTTLGQSYLPAIAEINVVAEKDAIGRWSRQSTRPSRHAARLALVRDRLHHQVVPAVGHELTGGLGILSYKTVAPHAYAAASEAADVTLAPVLTPEALPASTQPTSQHQRFQEIFGVKKEALLGSLTPEQAKAVIEASSKLGRVWLPTIPFQASLRHTDFEVAAALQLCTLAGEREAHCTLCGEANFFWRGFPPEESMARGTARGCPAGHRTGPWLHSIIVC